MEKLASDAVAGFEMLRRRADINPRQIGIMGGSEGGWVAPEAASRLSAMAFVIVAPASGLRLADHIVEEIREQMDTPPRRSGNESPVRPW